MFFLPFFFFFLHKSIFYMSNIKKIINTFMKTFRRLCLMGGIIGGGVTNARTHKRKRKVPNYINLQSLRKFSLAKLPSTKTFSKSLPHFPLSAIMRRFT